MSLPIPKCVGVYKQPVFLNNMRLMEIIVQVDKENHENYDVSRFIDVLTTNCYSYHKSYANEINEFDDPAQSDHNTQSDHDVWTDFDTALGEWDANSEIEDPYLDEYEYDNSPYYRERYTSKKNDECEEFVGYIYKFYFDTSERYYLNNGPFHLPIPQKCWVLKLQNDDIEISYDTKYTSIDTERLNRLLSHYHITSYQYFKDSVYMYYSKN